MTQTPQVRRHKASDIPALVELAGQLAQMHRALDPRRFNWTADLPSAYRSWFTGALSHDERSVFVAEFGKTIVGYAMAELFAQDTAMWSPAHAFLHDIHVVQTARRLGAARMLVNAVADWARGRGVNQVRAITAADNEGAARFFNNHGFRPAAVERVLDLT